MDHGGQLEMEDSIMSQEVDLCDNHSVSAVNLNKLALASDNENVQQGSTPDASSDNCKNDEGDKAGKDICAGQVEEDQDEVMKEEEDDSEESTLFRCQSPETPMTDSSYSETGSLLETPYVLSPGTSPEPTSTLFLSEAPTKPSAVDLSYSETASSIEKSAVSGSEQSSDDVLDRNLTPKIGPCAVSEEKPLQCVSFENREVSSHHRESSDQQTETSKPSCTEEVLMHQDPSELLVFLEQLSQRGDDTHLPLYLHQIAEAFVSHEDYQRAIWCLQLERLYHQRLLDNLSALQRQWETQSNTASSAPTSPQLDSLRQICLTHRGPKASDAVCASLDRLVVPSCSSDCQAERTMEQLTAAEESSGSTSLSHTIDQGDEIDSSELTQRNQEDSEPERKGRLHQAQSGEEELKAEEPEGRPEGTMSAPGDGGPPSCCDDMDQSKTAEQQGGDLSPAREQEADTERDVEEATEALDMDEEEEEEEEGQNGKAFTFCPETLPVETVVSAAAVETRLQEAKSETERNQLSPEETQGIGKSSAPSEMPVSEDDDLNRPWLDAEREEEEDEDYEMEQADLIRAAAALDSLAKMITVEEMAPAPGLVSILKKRAERESSPTSVGPETASGKTPKRRVRFRVPDDGFDNEMGGGDSCLLLFLLCLVTVVISIGGTALYCALGDTHSSVCQDFSRNADFYFGQIQRGITQIQHWLTPTS